MYSLIRPPRTGFRRICCVGHGGAGSVTFVVEDVLGDALVRSGCVAVRLVVGQGGAQMPFAEDQHAVEELSAQGADEPLAGRVHARSLDGGAQDPGPGGLEDGVERGGEIRSTVADQELDVLEPLVEAEGKVAGLLHGPFGCSSFVVSPARSGHCSDRVPGDPVRFHESCIFG